MSLVTSRLGELENIIERGLQTFVEVGLALSEIRDGRLYREGHSTFEAYLDERWGMSRSRAHRLIDGARIAELVLPIGNIANEAQARELVPLLDKATPEVIQQVYTEAITEADGRPSARAIREKVEEVLSQNGGKATRKRHSKVDADIEFHLSEVKRLIPRWESRFVDSHSAKEGRRRVALAEDIAAWLAGDYVPAHAALVTPLAKVPT